MADAARRRPDARRQRALRWAAHGLAVLPALWLIAHALSDGLGVNPVNVVIRTTGKTALVLLVASLACTPSYRILGWRDAVLMRRPLGLWAFAYGVAHLLAFVGLDYGFDLGFILADGLPKKPYILVGLAALLLLACLAATSTKAWQRRLGRRWKPLHRLVYAAVALAGVHYYWVMASTLKGGSAREPKWWAAGIAVLLFVRIPAVRVRLAQRPKRAALGNSPARL